jgi:small subunit ribosomal protein S4
MHGASKRRGKQSEYSTQLMEKQKVKYTYGVLERQFENLFHRASAKEGITGENLLKFLEARLDNAVYRLGISPTRSGARQLVNHKHINVNGAVVNIASYALKAGDVISVREKSKTLEAITTSVAGRRINKYSWLAWDANELTGTFLNYPNRDEIPENIKENLIVELYSK